MERAGPRNRIVVLASDAHPHYASLMPLTAYLWRHLIDYVPLVYFVEPVSSFVLQKTLEARACVRQLDTPPRGFASANAAQNVRLFAALESTLAEDTYLLTSDADMWPLSAMYFHHHQDWTKKVHLFNAWGMSERETEYPLCYIGACVSAWRDILQESTLPSSRGLRDQPFITKLIQAWHGYPDQVHKMSRPLDRRFPGFHMRYTDRIDKVEWRDFRPGDVDCHLPRGGDHVWQKLRQLLEQIGMASAWTDDYIKQIDSVA